MPKSVLLFLLLIPVAFSQSDQGKKTPPVAVQEPAQTAPVLPQAALALANQALPAMAHSPAITIPQPFLMKSEWGPEPSPWVTYGPFASSFVTIFVSLGAVWITQKNSRRMLSEQQAHSLTLLEAQKRKENDIWRAPYRLIGKGEGMPTVPRPTGPEIRDRVERVKELADPVGPCFVEYGAEWRDRVLHWLVSLDPLLRFECTKQHRVSRHGRASGRRWDHSEQSLSDQSGHIVNCGLRENSSHRYRRDVSEWEGRHGEQLFLCGGPGKPKHWLSTGGAVDDRDAFTRLAGVVVEG